jgi:hypothetical protein
MIVKKGLLCALVLCLQAGSTISAPMKSPRLDVDKEALAEVVLTAAEAQEVLYKLEAILELAARYDKQNRAPRPDAAQPCDGIFPACNTIDLTDLNLCCCQLKNSICCLGSIIDTVIGNCTDPSILLPSVVDKSDIDAICASTTTLLKTILLELRGAFLIV